MRPVHGRHQVILTDQLGIIHGTGPPTAQDRRIHLAAFHQGDPLGGFGFHYLQLHLFSTEGIGDLGDTFRHALADGQRYGDETLGLFPGTHFTAQFTHITHDGGGKVDSGPSLGGETHCSVGPVEELHPQLTFESADLLTDHRLRQEKRLGGPAEILFPGGRKENLQLPDLHVLPPPPE